MNEKDGNNKITKIVTKIKEKTETKNLIPIFTNYNNIFLVL